MDRLVEEIVHPLRIEYASECPRNQWNPVVIEKVREGHAPALGDFHFQRVMIQKLKSRRLTCLSQLQNRITGAHQLFQIGMRRHSVKFRHPSASLFNSSSFSRFFVISAGLT